MTNYIVAVNSIWQNEIIIYYQSGNSDLFVMKECLLHFIYQSIDISESKKRFLSSNLRPIADIDSMIVFLDSSGIYAKICDEIISRRIWGYQSENRESLSRTGDFIIH
jgi:hypothetical protein